MLYPLSYGGGAGSESEASNRPSIKVDDSLSTWGAGDAGAPFL